MVSDHHVTITLSTPTAAQLSNVVPTMGAWQREGAAVQLHPGDVGWFWRFGAAATAAAIRTWSADGKTLAVGLLDEPTVLRLAIDPDLQQDAELALRLAEDLTDPARAVLSEKEACVEAPAGALIREVLTGAGWRDDQLWTPLRRDLTTPVEQVPPPGVRIEAIGPDRAGDRVAVQRAAFTTSTFTEERWLTMAAGAAYADARCLIAYDDQGDAVAAVTVWSAGPGRPGLLEPMGVHRDHRGQGLGRAITLAAAAALQELGSSSAVVCTPSSNEGAVATYASAGFTPLPAVPDLRRSVG